MQLSTSSPFSTRELVEALQVAATRTATRTPARIPSPNPRIPHRKPLRTLANSSSVSLTLNASSQSLNTAPSLPWAPPNQHSHTTFSLAFTYTTNSVLMTNSSVAFPTNVISGAFVSTSSTCTAKTSSRLAASAARARNSYFPSGSPS